MWLRITTSSTIFARSSTLLPQFVLIAERILSGTYFSSDNNVIAPVEVFLQGQDELFYKTGIQKMQTRQNKCIEVGGDCVEK